MAIKAVLFDMDGTLIPLDQDEFVRAYFKELAKVLCPLGITPEALTKAIWTGTEAMVVNDGSMRNDAAFWKKFETLTDIDIEKSKAITSVFYSNEFNNAKYIASENPLAQKAIDLAKKNGRKVVLATNPIFPMDGQVSRLGWIGIDPNEFEFITAYETESYCKPNPKYFLSICERLGVEPSECVMVGNDTGEDMFPASSIGMTCFLVTDNKIEKPDKVWTGNQGSFAELITFLEGIE